jgi:hypothetical protein
VSRPVEQPTGGDDVVGLDGGETAEVSVLPVDPEDRISGAIADAGGLPYIGVVPVAPDTSGGCRGDDGRAPVQDRRG